ncbi:MAG TPA: hypothetical protein VNI57_02270 [Candidatus Saccharimonadales bacterium]|nr:hypothetical protein [Candidatus Saccharimonadales bacterium]
MRNRLQIKALSLPGALLLLLAGFAPAALANVEGSAELLYRNVSVDGSTAKYNEDFNGLNSGMRIGNLDLDWTNPDLKLADYARLTMTGMGGDPYEASTLKLGRADVYDLTFSHRKQAYLYDLFQVTDDMDGHTWNTDRSWTGIDLRIHALEHLDVILGFHEVDRRGDQLFMKDIQRDLFRLDTPLDQLSKSYTAGVDARVGTVDIIFRQELQNKNLEFDNLSDGNPGLDPNNSTVLTSYSWRQRDTTNSDYTTVKVHSPLGSRVDLSLSAWGSFLGSEKMKSRVRQDASGTDFNGNPFTISGGFSDADITGDTFVGDLDVAVKIIDPLTFIAQYRDMRRMADGEALQNLNADPNTAPTRADVQLNYRVNTVAGILEYTPHRTVKLRGGYKSTNRDLIRTGFDFERNQNFSSHGDTTAIIGASWRPRNWLRFMASYEDGNREQPFKQISLMDTQRLQFRATINPRTDMTVGASYTDYKNDNDVYNSSAEGESWSLSFAHNVNERFSYSASYAKQNMDTATPIIFDTAAFGGTEPGDTAFDADNDEGFLQVNYKFTRAWDSFVKVMLTRSDGNNTFIGNASGTIDDFVIDQNYQDVEGGVVYHFASGLFVGGSFRDFKYNDRNSLIDYQGQIFLLRAGTTF